jgi:hypothetical protein
MNIVRYRKSGAQRQYYEIWLEHFISVDPKPKSESTLRNWLHGRTVNFPKTEVFLRPLYFGTQLQDKKL